MTVARFSEIISEYEGILERACRITENAPFFMAADQQSSRLSINEGTATLKWSEYDGGYYAGEGSIEEQSVKFPAELLLMSLDEIAAWKSVEIQKHMDAEKANKVKEALIATAQRKAAKLRQLAALKAKYEGAAN